MIAGIFESISVQQIYGQKYRIYYQQGNRSVFETFAQVCPLEADIPNTQFRKSIYRVESGIANKYPCQMRPAMRHRKASITDNKQRNQSGKGCIAPYHLYLFIPLRCQ